MKKFINDPYEVVDEMLEGYLKVHSSYMYKLDNVRTVVRNDAPIEGKVGVVTGGGSGHKPAFHGFVGKGMLDAVAMGEIFTSPPPLACVEAVKAADSGKGVLILLGNYAGDVMNFQLAADMAGAEGIKVEQVIGTDDVGSGAHVTPDKRRGVTAAFFAWKVAGAMSDSGASLEECKAAAEKVNANSRTIGVAIGPCTLPAKGSPSFTLADDEMEYAVGHHGEAGTERIAMMPVDDIVTKMAGDIINDLPFQSGDEVAVLVNGLGGTPQCELYIAYRKLASILEEKNISVGYSGVGEFFTGLEMAGFSITLMKLDDQLKKCLAAPCDTPAHKVL